MIQEGNVCRCTRGIVGVVNAISYGCKDGTDCRPTYFGQTLDGNHWQSVAPVKLAESIDEYEQDGGQGE
jgi:hypothetical protein